MTDGARIERDALARVVVAGSERRDFLQRLVTNDVSGLAAGRGVPALLLERTGRLVDRVIVADRGRDFLLVGGPGRSAVVVAWLERHVIADDVTVEDMGLRTRLCTVVGERGAAAISDALGVPASGLAPWEHRDGAAGGETVTVLRAEDLGSPSFHVIGTAAALGDALAGLPAVGQDVWDALRVEAGVPAFGAELDERTMPLEARLTDSISFTKGCYVGQEVIARLRRQDRVKRTLVRLRLDGDTTPAPDAPVLAGGDEIGAVTSVARTPRGIFALAYVKAGRGTPGERLGVAGGGAEVLPLTPAGDPVWT